MHDFGSFVIRSSRGLGSLIMRCRLVITALTLNQSSEPLDILLAFRSRGSSPGYGGLVFLWSNFPSLMVDYCVQLGNLLLLITSPILI